MGIPGHLSIRTIKLSDQERRIVAELHPSDGLGNQRMQQFRASVHFRRCDQGSGRARFGR